MLGSYPHQKEDHPLCNLLTDLLQCGGFNDYRILTMVHTLKMAIKNTKTLHCLSNVELAPPESLDRLHTVLPLTGEIDPTLGSAGTRTR